MSWRWPEVRLRPALRVATVMLALGVWQALTEILALRSGGNQTPWPEPFVWEITGVVAGFVTLWIPFAAALNTRRPFLSARNVALHLGAFVAFAAIKDTLMIGARFALYPALGWGKYSTRSRSSSRGRTAMRCSSSATARRWCSAAPIARHS